MKRPLILVCNDDGIFAPGIRALVEVVSEFGDVIVCAPDSPQSAKSNAITVGTIIRLNKVDRFNDLENVEAYACSGTPVDSIKLAKYVLFKDRKPDLCVSGINHGSNASVNILYSGTMSAAMEGALFEVNSIGFSLLDFSQDANFEPSKKYVRKIVKYVLDNGLQNGKLLNVNIPNLKPEEIKGIKVCRQADAVWQEEYHETLDPFGRPYYFLTGEFINKDEGNDTDIWALENGYVSIVPSMCDLTDYPEIDRLKIMENGQMNGN